MPFGKEQDVMSDFNDPTSIATPEQYRAALLAVRERMTDDQLKMPASTLPVRRTLDLHPIAWRKSSHAHTSSAKTRYSKLRPLDRGRAEVRAGPWNKKSPVVVRLAYSRPNATETVDGKCEWIMRPELVATCRA